MKAHFSSDGVQWAETSEQPQVLEVELPSSTLPLATMSRMTTMVRLDVGTVRSPAIDRRTHDRRL